MSYILDALKKAERERGMAKIPTISTVHDTGKKPSSRIRFFSIAVLVLLAAGLGWLFFPRDRDKDPVDGFQEYAESGNRPDLPASGIDASASEVTGSSSPGLNQGRNDRFTASVKTPLQESGAARPDSIPATASASRNTPANSRIRSKEAASNSIPERSTRQPETRQPAVAVAENNSAGTAYLPSGDPGSSEYRDRLSDNTASESVLQQAMETMDISVLFFAETPSERLVFINGRKYAEGDSVDGRFLIEKITPDGAVLSYQGARALLKPRTD